MKIAFIQGYRMPLKDFEVLVELLRNGIAPNFRQSNRRCEELIYVYTKMIVAVGIRVLASGNYDDIMKTFVSAKVLFTAHVLNF
jgi:hypothetical protein